MDMCGKLSLLQLVIAAAVSLAKDAGPIGDSIEYCEDEIFQAKCNADEAVVIQVALYGRMNIGRCVTRNYGNIGCAIEVKSLLDERCSGRHSCEVPVSTLMTGATKPCPKDFRSYLEVSFTCVKVMQGPRDQCRSSPLIETSQPHGFISSLVAEETGCGSIDAPWVITVPSGQRINFTLWDFGITAIDHHGSTGILDPAKSFPAVCHVYAILKEKTVPASKTICSGLQRRTHVYTSSENAVEVRLVTKRRNEDEIYGHFLLEYDVSGCPDLMSPPAGTKVSRTDTRAIIECVLTDERWLLTCHGNKWHGALGNCSRIPLANADASSMWTAVTSSQGISIAIIVGVAVLVGIVILLIGLFILKWQRSKRPVPDPLSPVGYHDGSRPYGSATLSKSRDPMDPYGINENNYYRTWQLQRNKPKHADLPPPPYHPVSTGSDGQDYRYVEHVYESPHFDRRDMSGGPPCSSMAAAELSPTGGGQQQYFVLDPEAEAQCHMGPRSRNNPDPRELHEIGWIKPDEVTFANGR